MWTARRAARRVGRSVALGPADAPEVLRLCAHDPAACVYVASRVQEQALRIRGHAHGWRDGDRLTSLVLAGANVVPVGLDERSADGLAEAVAPRRSTSSSVFGEAEQVERLWGRLREHWGPARDERMDQWSMVTSTPPSRLGVHLDPRVRPARPSEIGLVVPAGAAMFTEEIGYPPYQGSDAAYRMGFERLIAQGRSFVVVEDGQVVFKADVGAVAFGVAQVQGVWTSPEHRGRGLATAAMAGVVEHLLTTPRPVIGPAGAPVDRIGTVHLYVNDYNLGARTVYERIGMRRVGTFATVIL
ncbi:hypothetical protein SAMN05445756_1792 [Kytococcus aerolatus]|uniref:N-acetyltransferase domain-containing protein n=1 Tax=Kytococcus aerolatus TaxID=592308 RepID=A0A212U224_9MICO|nr:DUF4081 domain-containing GNAT family N-acetyltransferase [Kytococcus aerolatus]SNC72288.1 hypothetical protein SAMN05445756_1792 [Kytococcus aerolatus]